MTLKITINTDNAAFDGRMEYEVASILLSFLARIQNGGGLEMPLRDTNGNTVGEARLTRR